MAFMERVNINSENSMKALKGMLKEQFPQIQEMDHSDDYDHFDIEIMTNQPRSFLKSLNEYLGRFLLDYGDKETIYSFKIQRGRELLDILRFNDDNVFYIEMEIDGKLRKVRVLDVMGATGDYSVFNEDFERLGTFYTDGAVNFSDISEWETNDELLKPYLDEIIHKIAEQIKIGEEDSINPDDPLDLEFYSEQFEISPEELKEAIESVGTSIFAIRKYLQK